MTRNEGMTLMQAGLAYSPAHQRSSLEGRHRNEAEAKRLRGFIASGLTHHRHGRVEQARAILDTMQGTLAGLREVLTPTGTAQYAPVDTTPEGVRRSLEAALEVAGNNICRAVGAGDTHAALRYLDTMRVRLKGEGL